jgi:predicted amidophosphoribosyltransferase
VLMESDRPSIAKTSDSIPDENFCTTCGKERERGMSYCNSCGQRFER